MRFKGTLSPLEHAEWRAEGRLTAAFEQTCVVTLGPVLQHIDERLARLYLPAEDHAEEPDIDFEPDDEDEPDLYSSKIDLGALAIEAMALALDPYPRVEDATVIDHHHAAPPGIKPLDDKDLKPFAKLSELKERIGGKNS